MAQYCVDCSGAYCSNQCTSNYCSTNIVANEVFDYNHANGSFPDSANDTIYDENIGRLRTSINDERLRRGKSIWNFGTHIKGETIYSGGSGSVSVSYKGKYTVNIGSTTTNFNITTASDTQALVLCGCVKINGNDYRYITNVSVNGSNANLVLDVIRDNSEYNAHSSIWAINNVPGGQTVSIEVVTNTTTSYNVSDIYIYELTSQFNNFSPNSSGTDKDHSDPLDVNLSFYDGGVAFAVWHSYNGTASVDTPFVIRSGGSGNITATAMVQPTSDQTKTINFQDGAGGNDGQTVVAVSYRSSKFTSVSVGSEGTASLGTIIGNDADRYQEALLECRRAINNIRNIVSLSISDGSKARYNHINKLRKAIDGLRAECMCYGDCASRTYCSCKGDCGCDYSCSINYSDKRVKYDIKEI